jgi:hypothetical protein
MLTAWNPIRKSWHNFTYKRRSLGIVRSRTQATSFFFSFPIMVCLERCTNYSSFSTSTLLSVNVFAALALQKTFWKTLHYLHHQWKSHWTVTISRKTRCLLLHYDSSNYCACPLNKYIQAFKVESSFWNTLHHQWKSHWTVTISRKTWCLLLHYDSSNYCACPLNKYIYV